MSHAPHPDRLPSGPLPPGPRLSRRSLRGLALRGACLPGLCLGACTAAEPASPAAGAPAPAAATATSVDAPKLPGHLVFLAEDGEGPGPGAIVAIEPDGGGRKELLRGTGLYPAAVAPGGAHLAIIAVDETGEHVERLQIHAWTGDALGQPVWVSPPASHVRNPSFGPDGRFVVFEASMDSFRDLYRVELPTGTTLRLTNNAEGNFEPAVAPDGRTIAFVSSRDGNAEIYRMSADGGEQTRLTSFHLDDWGPIWSPDGKTLAFLSNREQMDRIFVMGPDGADPRRFTADKTVMRDPDAPTGDEPHETDPAFSPDGATIAYCVRTGSQGAKLQVAPLAGGPAVTLTDGKTSDRSPVWSPDGTHLVFVSNRDGGDLELYRVARTGGPALRLTARPAADWLPRWAPR